MRKLHMTDHEARTLLISNIINQLDVDDIAFRVSEYFDDTVVVVKAASKESYAYLNGMSNSTRGDINAFDAEGE